MSFLGLPQQGATKSPLKTTEIYPPTLLEARSLQLGVAGSVPPDGSRGGGLPCLSAASGGCQRPPVCLGWWVHLSGLALAFRAHSASALCTCNFPSAWRTVTRDKSPFSSSAAPSRLDYIDKDPTSKHSPIHRYGLRMWSHVWREHSSSPNSGDPQERGQHEVTGGVRGP